jgi:hypothetical protein
MLVLRCKLPLGHHMQVLHMLVLHKWVLTQLPPRHCRQQQELRLQRQTWLKIGVLA